MLSINVFDLSLTTVKHCTPILCQRGAEGATDATTAVSSAPAKAAEPPSHAPPDVSAAVEDVQGLSSTPLSQVSTLLLHTRVKA